MILIKFLPGGRPRPFFATGLPSSSNAGSALKKTKNKIEVSKWDKKNLALKIHNSMKKSRHTFLFAAFFSLSGLGGLPLPLLAGFTSSSVAIVVWIWKLKKMRVYGSNLPINIAPCIIVKTIAWKNLRYQFLYYEMNECSLSDTEN